MVWLRSLARSIESSARADAELTHTSIPLDYSRYARVFSAWATASSDSVDASRSLTRNRSRTPIHRFGEVEIDFEQELATSISVFIDDSVAANSVFPCAMGAMEYTLHSVPGLEDVIGKQHGLFWNNIA